jgi:predicted nucleotidyltransferase
MGFFMDVLPRSEERWYDGSASVRPRSCRSAGYTMIMPTLEELLTTLRSQHEILSRRYPIRRLALFGSWARGEAREDSDVDVLVDVDPSIGLRFVELGDELERALGRRVDLVSRRAIRPALWERIEPELIDA